MTPHYVNQGGEMDWLLDDLVEGRASMGRARMGHPSMPLPQLTPQPRDVPSAGSMYSPYPMTAGQSDPAPYAE